MFVIILVLVPPTSSCNPMIKFIHLIHSQKTRNNDQRERIVGIVWYKLSRFQKRMFQSSRNNPIRNIGPKPTHPLRPYLHINIHTMHLNLVHKNHLSRIQKPSRQNRLNHPHHPQMQYHPLLNPRREHQIKGTITLSNLPSLPDSLGTKADKNTQGEFITKRLLEERIYNG